MKLKKAKTLKKSNGPPKRKQAASVEEVNEAIVELDSELSQVRSRLADLKSELLKERSEFMANSIEDFGKFFDSILRSMLYDVHTFLRTAPIWDILKIRNVGLHGVEYKELQKYYAQGYRVLGTNYDPASGESVAGFLLHRPKPPDTPEQLLEMYKAWLVAPPANGVIDSDKKPDPKHVAAAANLPELSDKKNKPKGKSTKGKSRNTKSLKK